MERIILILICRNACHLIWATSAKASLILSQIKRRRWIKYSVVPTVTLIQRSQLIAVNHFLSLGVCLLLMALFPLAGASEGPHSLTLAALLKSAGANWGRLHVSASPPPPCAAMSKVSCDTLHNKITPGSCHNSSVLPEISFPAWAFFSWAFISCCGLAGAFHYSWAKSVRMFDLTHWIGWWTLWLII